MTTTGSQHFPNHLITSTPKISSRQHILFQAPGAGEQQRRLPGMRGAISPSGAWCPAWQWQEGTTRHLSRALQATPRSPETWDPGTLSTAGSLPCTKCLRSASSTAGKPSGRIFHAVLLFWIRTQLPPELFKFMGLRSELSTQAGARLDKGLSREHWVQHLSEISQGPITDLIPASFNQKMTL